jgi:tRNA(adenine34) deaminase
MLQGLVMTVEDQAAIWMQEALSLAQKAAQEDEVPVGAVVVYQNQVIGRGYNQREHHHDPLAHAEMRAIAEAAQFLKSWRLIDCLLVVTLEPCPMCLAACQQARVQEVVYGALDKKGGALSLGYRLNEDVRTNHRFPVYYLETPKCSQILKDFFSSKRTKTSDSL